MRENDAGMAQRPHPHWPQVVNDWLVFHGSTTHDEFGIGRMICEANPMPGALPTI